ncbi:MAG: hypothetical protein JRG95_18040 [Deltaproteobacteria bacterium]|nr:hypothetical protein [Deltaproteobacteria bacterium]
MEQPFVIGLRGSLVVVTTDSAPAERSGDWLLLLFQVSRLAPAWIGLGLAITFPLLVGLVHMLAEALLGPVDLPQTPLRFAATHVVDGAFVAVLLAGHAHLHLGAISDLRELRPLLPLDDADFGRLVRNLANLSAPMRRLATIVGALGGFAVATLDPTLRDRFGHLSASDPRYILFVGQNVLFGVFLLRLIAAEVHMTRAYMRLGERIEIDLLDLKRLRVFARKGLRSVLVWVLLSSVLSLFWVLDSAGQTNTQITVILLALVVLALVAPSLGVHRAIAAAKEAELRVVAEAIRSERAATLAPRRTGAPAESRTRPR